MNYKLVYVLIIWLCCQMRVVACQCPATGLSLAECNKYEVIFKGRIDSVRACHSNFGEAFFTVEELYKGNASRQFSVLFECNVPCALTFNAGEEWIIYSRYKQVANVMMDWCSRSRKYFKIAKEDFYTVNYGNDYEQEVSFLRENLKVHRPMSAKKNGAVNRNERPSSMQTIIILICSLLTIIIFYWLFNKYFKF
ncbi:MAG: hypothetical protein H0W61_04900 [Bacteroidetes bacterium]|nr:hypothetical protein [Bacteroidota bacterium]